MATKKKKVFGSLMGFIIGFVIFSIIGIIISIESGFLPGIAIPGKTYKATITECKSAGRVTVITDNGAYKEVALAGVQTRNLGNKEDFIHDNLLVDNTVWVEELYQINNEKAGAILWFAPPQLLVTNRNFIFGTINGLCLLQKETYKVKNDNIISYNAFFNNLKLKTPNLDNEDNLLTSAVSTMEK